VWVQALGICYVSFTASLGVVLVGRHVDIFQTAVWNTAMCLTHQCSAVYLNVTSLGTKGVYILNHKSATFFVNHGKSKLN
jgi:hypothetical protein